jgi:hypothetical protein
MEKANDYLQNHFLVDYWDRKNTVLARDPELKFKELPAQIELKEILCLKDYRLVNRDHTINWHGITYQIEWSRKHSIRGRKIEIRTYSENHWRAFFAGDPVTLEPLPLTKIIPNRYLPGEEVAAYLG